MPGYRQIGRMDQPYYDWSPIVKRPLLTWPNNARVAVCLIVNLETWEWDVDEKAWPEPVSPMGGPAAPVLGTGAGRFPDIATFGQHQYGNRVGVYRVLDVLDKYGFKATAALDQVTAENYPWLIQEVAKRGAEFIAHGYSIRRRLHYKMTETEERKYIHDSIEAVAKATGKRPLGWSGPDFQETVNTPNLLAAEGIRYTCDWANDEQPYRMNVKEGELYNLGTDIQLDDIFDHLSGKRLIGEWSQNIRDSFDVMYKDGAAQGRLLVINLHPWVIGFPWRIKYLDQALAHIAGYSEVWKATGGEVIEHYRQTQGMKF